MGHHHHIHSTHFFELTDQPVSIMMAVTSEEAERLFQRFSAEAVSIFYVKTPVEFGMLGKDDPNK